MVRAGGPLAPFADGYGAELTRLGFTANSVVTHVVVGLELDDIDWRAGELRVRGKGGSDHRLPLLSGVGEVLAAYLRDGRSRRAESRKLFLARLAPP